MKTLPIIFFVLISMSCSRTGEEKAKIAQAEIWSPKIISSELPEFATSFNADKNEVYFNRTTPDRSSMQIMYSFKEGDVWSDPEALPFSTGEHLDVDPFITADGNRLYFTSSRPLDPEDTVENLDTWYVDRSEDGWSEPMNPGTPLNSDSTEIFTTMTASGNAYFVSEFDGKRGIKVSKYTDGNYQPPVPVILRLRGEEIYASNPCISSDETFLIVAARDPLGSGDPDLFIAWNNEDGWSELQNLGPLVNDSLYAEFAPGLSKDDKELYFTSERPGIVGRLEEGIRPPGDIYKIELQPILDQLRATDNEQSNP